MDVLLGALPVWEGLNPSLSLLKRKLLEASGTMDTTEGNLGNRGPLGDDLRANQLVHIHHN